MDDPGGDDRVSSSKPGHQAHVLRAIFISRERSPAPSLHVSLVMIDGVVTKTNDERPLGLSEGLIDLLIGPSALDRLNGVLRRRPSMGIARFVPCGGCACPVHSGVIPGRTNGF